MHAVQRVQVLQAREHPPGNDPGLHLPKLGAPPADQLGASGRLDRALITQRPLCELSPVGIMRLLLVTDGVLVDSKATSQHRNHHNRTCLS